MDFLWQKYKAMRKIINKNESWQKDNKEAIMITWITYCCSKCRWESDERESGAKPERSGHCKQGALSWKTIAYPFLWDGKTAWREASQETCLIHEMSFRVELKHPIRSQRRSGFVWCLLRVSRCLLFYEKIAIESISSNPEHIGGNSQHTSFCGRNPHLP